MSNAFRWAHYATLLAGFGVLMYVGSKQWFYYDEWQFIWQPEAAERFFCGHNGHWSAVPIIVWRVLQESFGLSSYLPFITAVTIVHLLTAHLLWRLLLRVGSDGWIATALITVFVFFGAGAENLLWAFQLGFVGAMTFGLGAMLLASRPRSTVASNIGIAALLTLGAATSGTALPFFLGVAWTLLSCHGWRTALVAMIAPTALYAGWYLGLRGPSATDAYRVHSIADALTGIPAFIGKMLVGSFDASTPVPGFGIVVVAAVTCWAVFVARTRRMSSSAATTSGMLLSIVLFAAMTAYSRLERGVDYADESRYVYVTLLMMLPAIALLLTWCSRSAWPARLVLIGLIGAVFLYNLGLLDTTARGWAGRERGAHGDISAALELADRYPDDVQWEGRPEPTYVPLTLGQLIVLEADYGLSRIAPTAVNRLSALVQVGVSVAPSDIPLQGCTSPLAPGDRLPTSAEAILIDAPDRASVTLAAVSGDVSGSPKTFELAAGGNAIRSVDPATLSIRDVTGVVRLCTG